MLTIWTLIMPNSVITQNDYKFIESNEENWYAVELLSGKWKGVRYIYGQVSIKEAPELNTATLAFTYNVVDSKGFEEDDLLNDINFKNYLGGVLQHAIEDSLDNGAYIGNNKSNTDTDTQSSD